MYHIVSERLKELLEVKSISLNQLADLSGIPFETLRNLYYAKNKNPRLDTLTAICKSLDISMDYLTGMIKRDRKEMSWIKLYQDCDSDYKDNLIELVEEHLACGRHDRGVSLNITKFEANYTRMLRTRMDKRHSVTCLIPDGHVEDGFSYSSCKCDRVETVFEEAYLAIKITTDNFIPSFFYGDIIVLANRYPKEGEKAVYTKGSKAYFREYSREQNKIILKTLSGIGEDFVLDSMDGFGILGTYINVIRWI